MKLTWILGLAALYVVTARLGLLLDAVSGFATLVWPPTGIALVALVLRGRWLWPGVALGAFAVNLWVGAPPLAAAGIAAGNTLEALVGAELVRRSQCDPSLASIADAAKLVLLVTTVSTALGATIGVSSLAAAGTLRHGFGATWLAWWLGDAMGDLVVAPLLATWLAPRRLESTLAPRRSVAARITEAAAVVVLVALVSLGVFFAREAPGAQRIYLVFPPLAWAVVRLGRRGGTAAVALVSGVAVAATALGRGPFAGSDSLHASLFELQSFMAIVAVTMLVLGAAIAERDRARRVALAAVQARDDFLAVAAHELRTPLSALLLQVGNLRTRLDDDDASKDRVVRAERQTDRLAKLVTNLLDVSRIESGQLAVSPEPGDLAEIVREAADRTTEEAARAQCTLSVRVTGPVVGRWDKLRIEQVLGNLIGNAYRHAAGAPVDVSLVADDDTARIEVRDHGAGVPPDARDSLFDRFRPQPARTRGGLGLGLYIARHLVVAHGGTLSARHESPGTAFVVELPRRPARAA